MKTFKSSNFFKLLAPVQAILHTSKHNY